MALGIDKDYMDHFFAPNCRALMDCEWTDGFLNVDVRLLAVSENVDEVESVPCTTPFAHHLCKLLVAAVVGALAAGRDADDVGV